MGACGEPCSARGAPPRSPRTAGFAHIVQNYDGCRCDVLLVRPSLLGPDRVVYRDPHPGEILGDAWSVENQLAAMVDTSVTGLFCSLIAVRVSSPAFATHT